ncbi:MAG: hypothetical protein ACI9CF_002007, partial [Candidatus Omnitrophota bacterium]
PIFIAGYMSLIQLFKSIKQTLIPVPSNERLPNGRLILFLWLWILPMASYYLINRTGEYRYLFPVYPALALLSGMVLNQWIQKSHTIFRIPYLGHGIIIVTIVLTAFWTIPIAWFTLFKEYSIIHVPFGPGEFKWW